MLDYNKKREILAVIFTFYFIKDCYKYIYRLL